jgi:adenylate kinase family enzyme
VIRRRWEIYERETFPVLNSYPKGIIREVDAMGAPAEVLQHVLEVIVPIQNRHFNNPLSGDGTRA